VSAPGGREEVCHLHVALFPLSNWVEDRLAASPGLPGAEPPDPPRAVAQAAGKPTTSRNAHKPARKG
jgi:hypothetical protein